MKIIHTQKTVPIPDGVTVKINCRHVVVTGPRGKLERTFNKTSFDMYVKNNTVFVELWFGQRLAVSSCRTIATHIRNMITGVTQGYRYKMRFVYAHFPHNVSITKDGTVVEIRNFLGEKVVRRVQMLEGVSVVRSDNVKDEIVLTGNSVENVSQSAANINLATLVKNKDVRKFLDGIYVSEKGALPVDE
eukprot:TRINITY_DN9655_c0_g1_i1.p2 TRINITY_DN9655_c0_g1~~TRINITY_DN9655_c0_g1_i1.p2  ORF type:complete len:189 (+),score=70.42 TRINITY_DN9655_c0_g1_i1:116-682(+)